MTREKRKTRHFHSLLGQYVHLSVFVLVLVLIISGGFYFLQSNKKILLETPKTEVKKLPPEIKKRLSETPPVKPIRVPILLYHYVEYVQDKNDTIRQSMNILPNIFEEQIITLKDAGYTFITTKELGDILNGKREAPGKPIVLTFDDGHWDLYTDIMPILKRHRVKATAYVVPGLIDNDQDFLTQKQLQSVVDIGLIEIAAHTVHHAYLPGRSLATIKYEIEASKIMLEQVYGVDIYSFAYPYGAFDQQVEKVVKEAGFTTAVSTVPGIMQSGENKFFLYRLRPGGRTGKYLLNWLANKDTFSAY